MATTIKLKNGSGAPLAGDLVQGEPALDLTNKRLYTEDSLGAVIEVGTNPTSLTTGTVTSDKAIVGYSRTAGTGGIVLYDDDQAENRLTLSTGGGTGINAAINQSGGSFNITDAGLNVVAAFNDSGNVGIGTASPAATLDVKGSARIERDGSSTLLQFTDTGVSSRWIGIVDGTSRFAIYGTNGSTEEFVIDSSGNLGIGTTSPSGTRLNVHAAGADQLRLVSTDGASPTSILMETNTGFAARTRIRNDSGNITFVTNNTAERARIDTSGNVGIGTTSPAYRLDTQTSSATWAARVLNTNANGGGLLVRTDSTNNNNILGAYGNGAYRMVVQADGNVGIGTTSPQKPLHVKLATNENVVIQTGGGGDARISAINDAFTTTTQFSVQGDPLIFRTSGGSEMARIDSSGNLLVGTTSGSYLVTCNGSGYFNYTVVNNGAVYNSFTGASGVTFSTTATRPTNNAGTPTDNTFDLGDPSIRWDDVYATNGTIQTSDANDKQDIEALSDAETRVAVAAKALLRKFRWKSAVEEKGDEARVHFGIIAQDLKAAFEAEGLDAGRYAMFIHSTWTDEETGEERSRMGVRYSELLAFIIAAI